MSVNCSTPTLQLFNAHRRILSEENGFKGKTPSHEETMLYLLENTPISKRAEQYMKLEKDLVTKKLPEVK